MKEGFVPGIPTTMPVLNRGNAKGGAGAFGN
jgi:hypothetical protein